MIGYAIPNWVLGALLVLAFTVVLWPVPYLLRHRAWVAALPVRVILGWWAAALLPPLALYVWVRSLTDADHYLLTGIWGAVALLLTLVVLVSLLVAVPLAALVGTWLWLAARRTIRARTGDGPAGTEPEPLDGRR